MGKVVERIKKLLALANDKSNDNEAQQALLMAQELMAKHHIEESQLEDIKKGEIIEMDAVINKGVPIWKASLARTLAKNFRCDIVYVEGKSGGAPNRKFIGYREDVEMCNLLLERTIEYITKRQKEYWQEVKHRYYSGAYRDVQRSYALGFVSGLSDKLHKNAEDNEWGLVVVTPPEVTDFTFSITHGRKKSQSYSGPTDMKAYDKGINEGNNYNFNSGDMPLNKIGGD